jgi:hypothetical protein
MRSEIRGLITRYGIHRQRGDAIYRHPILPFSEECVAHRRFLELGHISIAYNKHFCFVRSYKMYFPLLIRVGSDARKPLCTRLAAPWSCFTVSEAMPSIGIQFYRLVRNVLPIEEYSLQQALLLCKELQNVLSSPYSRRFRRQKTFV